MKLQADIQFILRANKMDIRIENLYFKIKVEKIVLQQDILFTPTI